MSDYKILIDGRLVAGDDSIDVINPATEEVLAACPRASVNQLNEAVAAAKAAFPAWSARPIEERRQMIGKMADAMEGAKVELARLLTQEQGKPLAEAMGEVEATILWFRELKEHDLPVKVIEDTDTRRIEQHRRALGVVGAIIPWNFPLLVVAFKVPFALLAGNTIVLKPSPTTPLSTLKIGELVADILPPGVLNIITDANDLGDKLSSHPDVAKISFTGSTETGKKVMANAVASIKRLTLELGGNDAAIVLPDVDPAKAAKGIYSGAMTNAGQVCLAIKRVYVHTDVYDSVCDELAKLADAAVVDDGLSQGVEMGPLQNSKQYEKVLGFLKDAETDGTIVTGGVVDRPGYFVRPTIVRDITDGHRLVDEEQFGPILPLIRFDNIEDALARANASPWGLGGSVWSSDRNSAHDIAKRMEAGSVWINQHLDIGPHIPFGGAKQSGVGVEYGEEGLLEFTQLHVINEAK